MATSQQAASSGTATAVGGIVNAIEETIAGSHVLKIDGFSATKDLGVGKSIKSSTFSVGGHGWYIECYPCVVPTRTALDGYPSSSASLFIRNKSRQDDACSF
jgi:speckle-type POZ protein